MRRPASRVLADDFSEDVFALDIGSPSNYLVGKNLGLPDRDLPRVPAAYRDADSLFQASFLTRGLKSLLEDVLGRLTGARGNRVLKLLTPFGGGKPHTLAALLHAARRQAEEDGLALRPDQGVLPLPSRPHRSHAGALGGHPGLPAHPRRPAFPGHLSSRSGVGSLMQGRSLR